MKKTLSIISISIISLLNSCASTGDDSKTAGQGALKPQAVAVKNIAIDDSFYHKIAKEKGAAIYNSGKLPVSPALLKKQVESRTMTELALLASPTSSDKNLTAAEVYSRCSKAVVLVGSGGHCKNTKCQKFHYGMASGAFVGKGVIVTNYHVVEQKGTDKLQFVITRDGTFLPVLEVLAANKDADCALIRVDYDNKHWVRLQPYAPAGTKVFGLTHPNQTFYHFTEGQISRRFIDRGRGGPIKRIERLHITAEYAKGSSGGPIFNEKGEIVAMVSYTNSIYYTTTKGVQKNFQMVFRGCVSAESIVNMIKKPQAKEHKALAKK